MPEYLAPGVYVEEVDLGVKPIEGVSTSTAGFLGVAERGPVAPQFVTSFTQFVQVYGGFLDDSYLAWAVDGFFRNGGQRSFVARIVPATPGAAPTDQPAEPATAALTLGPLELSAVGPGTWGNRIFARIEPGTTAAGGSVEPFKLTFYYWRNPPSVGADKVIDPTDPRNRFHPQRREPDVVEVFDNLSINPASPNRFERRVNGVSRLVRVERGSGTVQTVGRADEATLNGAGAPGSVLDKHLAGGSEGPSARLSDYQGVTELGRRTGLAAFEEIDEIAIVAAPDEASVNGLTAAVIDHCESLRDRFAVTAANPDAAEYRNFAALRPPRDSKYAAFYYPWITVLDPVTGATRAIPPTGHVVGVYARSDTERGVHKAPANEVVRGVVGLDLTVGKAEQDLLNPRGVNVIRSFPARGIRVWGARTMSSDPAWKYVNVRRLFLFLEESIDEGTQYAVFEPNDISLWERLRGSVSAFLTTQWRSGRLQGATAEQAYFVKVGLGETMTQDDVDNGRVIVLVGVAPVKPAEFVIFRVTQMPQGATITE